MTTRTLQERIDERAADAATKEVEKITATFMSDINKITSGYMPDFTISLEGFTHTAKADKLIRRIADAVKPDAIETRQKKDTEKFLADVERTKLQLDSIFNQAQDSLD